MTFDQEASGLDETPRREGVLLTPHPQLLTYNGNECVQGRIGFGFHVRNHADTFPPFTRLRADRNGDWQAQSKPVR